MNAQQLEKKALLSQLRTELLGTRDVSGLICNRVCLTSSTGVCRLAQGLHGTGFTMTAHQLSLHVQVLVLSHADWTELEHTETARACLAFITSVLDH